MNKLLDFGRKALFYVRVLSGYEERRIRSYRLQLEQRVQQAQARKAAINKEPEKIILSEVRRMVEEMQNLNKKLEETEAAIEDYFKPLDNEAEIIMKMQLQGEERTSEMMMKALEKQASLQQVEAEKNAIMHKVDNSEANLDDSKLMEEEKGLKEMLKELQREVLLEKADAGSSDNMHQSDKSHINLDPASSTTSERS
ncbi:hypothetical protein LR48_Vigan11g133100 [Vigna angularis]|uniref:Uncharacterized protein n=2 Tax=Phaseolus angularis TaxID=3914 RepID=A0A0L9VTV8_PHAAN|nr:uncharacterized protein LOC108346901 [Vigna angularis]XP_052724823.1 uncharacterized protein LOC108346901 [Vigna angularis]KAG2380902.1 uncharacterized protein HKW66_Vig0202750 [Vigna angularis]KOM58297.1 hypothetical protein LR48_Vigan11g133100 [Vigna angularis]BAT97160.1 hypothetical protein VIGAN_09052900 [Vigna angularis var. angularis]